MPRTNWGCSIVDLPGGNTVEEETCRSRIGKAVSDVYAPVGGTVVKVNEELGQAPS